MDDEVRDRILFETAGQNFQVYNQSHVTFTPLRGQDAKDIHRNFLDYVTKFSPNVRDIFLEKFLFTKQLKRLNDSGLLYQVFEKFAQIDLHPDVISTLEMGYLFEKLIRRFSEISNETACEQYTPRIEQRAGSSAEAHREVGAFYKNMGMDQAAAAGK